MEQAMRFIPAQNLRFHFESGMSLGFRLYIDPHGNCWKAILLDFPNLDETPCWETECFATREETLRVVSDLVDQISREGTGVALLKP